MKTFCLWLGLCLVGSQSLAYAGGNPKAGEEKSAACAGCHGEDGNGTAPIFPKLAGQHGAYLSKQLSDFKSQKRVEPTMNAMAESLDEDDMRDIGAYYSELQLTPETGEPNALGEKIYKSGNPATGVPACTGCHGPRGSGNPHASIPLLHGQYAAYLEKTLADFRAGERGNDMNAMMRTVAAKLTDQEISAVADYLASLKP